MIVSCPNCSKKFNISESLIPKNGRLLQCSNCNHKWYFQIPNETADNVKPIKLIDTQEQNNKENIVPKIFKNKKSTKKTKTIKKKVYKKNKETISKTENKNKISKEKNISLFNSFLIIVISVTAIIIIVDTFKVYISIYFPTIIPILDNLFNIFFDINSFIKDLIK